MSASLFKRLVRFAPRSNTSGILIGQPVKDDIDVGLALRNDTDVQVQVFSGTSVLNPGQSTGKVEIIHKIFSPLAASEVGTIRCIGLNYKRHADEVSMELPPIPTMFMKPSTALGDPWPTPTLIPKISQEDGTSDFESELAVILGKSAKNVLEAEAMDQLAQSQWNFSKGFDGACPIGPTLVSRDLVPDPTEFKIRGLKNGKVMQESGLDDLIFGIPQIIAFLSQGTTLPAGTIIITGTPAGVGMGRTPKERLDAGDEFHVEILPYIGTLVSIFKNE
ncbi:Fumarylacetoacetate hydrolase domain-containing protein 2 [Fusarium oxysporum f. sp. rapae]|uniref:Fumarylacetoacetate hydrolase domain-containing protein 2 n=1 Tax=Fusarium oxysporum f. sp. rapae TaxID=485398 RepID=A0A8J5NL65_FUSOX|nr:Fumarylacetoacetate hydrolase domain-containing protein 2 [Fusarium oxysporum f. sp. rapae]